MKLRRTVVGLGIVLAALTAGGDGRAQQAGPPLPPLPYQLLKKLHDDPVAWEQFRARHAAVPAAPEQAPGASAPTAAPAWVSAWKMMLANPVLLTDGTVMAQVSCTSDWFRLTPDIDGKYETGTWSRTAPMQTGYSPRFFSSAVLPDGRLIVEGGEYDGAKCSDIESPRGSIYDPQANTWTPVARPSGWTTIGDASGIVLANGTYLLSNCCTTQSALFDATTRKWTATGAGKADENNEENWTLLPNGDVLTVDAYTGNPPPPCGAGAEAYVPSTGRWASAGSTLHRLSSCSGSIQSFEAPTQILRPAGKVVAFGSTASNKARDNPVYTSFYTPGTGTWAAGPTMPKVNGQYYTMADAPAAILPNGDVLIAASPSIWANASSYPSPVHFFIFNGTTFTQVADIADSPELASYEMNFLVLPTGQIFGVETDFSRTEIFPAVCCAKAGWAPSIETLSSRTLNAGGTYSLTGKQLSGLTEGASYGDDVQADTNFPLVRITNNATHHVFYARTFGFGRSIATGAVSSTSFALPAKIETGAGELVVVANGISSTGEQVTVEAAAAE